MSLLRRHMMWGSGLLGSAIAGGTWASSNVAPLPHFPAPPPAEPASLDLPAMAAPAPLLPHLDYGPAARAAWLEFQGRFIARDGRIVDTGNAGVSHSEGQGLGMLFAVAFDDAATFEMVDNWTTSHLRRAGDALHAWRYVPGAVVPVADTNNATDGDIYIAAALSRAAARWNRPDLASRAALIAGDIQRLLLRRIGQRVVLLPGAQGFEHQNLLVLNPSYYAFGLFADLDRALPSSWWAKLAEDGQHLIAQGRFGPWRLPPDWLQIDRDTGMLSPAPAWPARFSYDAIRVPLHLTWAGLADAEISATMARLARARAGHAPAWVDLQTGDLAAQFASPGMQAIARLAAEPRGDPAPLQQAAYAPADYYSSALSILCCLAYKESAIL